MEDEIIEATPGGLTIREASNILFLAPSPHPTDITICTDFLSICPPEDANVWCLGITLSAAEREWYWKSRVGSLPTEFKVLSAGPLQSNNTTDPPDTVPGHSPEEITCDHLTDPSNLTEIGINLTSTLSEWESNGNQTMICIHSISSLLQYVPLNRVFQFLHKITLEVDQTNAVAHYHMDPSAHEPETIGKLRQLFDSVVRIDKNDNWEVITREIEAEGTGTIPTLDFINRPTDTNP